MPSSHTANATGVCLLFLLHIYRGSIQLPIDQNYVFAILAWYWVSLVLGRVYCGMHGLVDVISGAIIGSLVTTIRVALGRYWDNFVIDTPEWYVPLLITLIYYSYVYFHPTPEGDCPCFEDSVAFLGVMMGLDLSHWVCSNVGFLKPASIGFDYEHLGLTKTILRVIVGIGMVVIWKAISKSLLVAPLVGLILPPKQDVPCYALKRRMSHDIWVKLIVYAGIATTVIVGTKIVFPLLGIDVPLL